MTITLIVALLALAGLLGSYYLRRSYLRSGISITNATSQSSADTLLPDSPKRSEDNPFSYGVWDGKIRRKQKEDPPLRRPSGEKRYTGSRPRAATLSMALSDPGLIMQIVLSLVVVGAGLFMILSGRYDASNQHWAYGIVGTAVGFWLKGAR